jgi:hypothetical protein
MRILIASVLCVVLGTAATAVAKRADHDPRLLTLLRGIDTVPTRAAIRNVVTAPDGYLIHAALDEDLSLYERRRALSLLALFPTQLSEVYLTSIGWWEPNARIRWVAIYAYCRGWAKTAPMRVLDYARWALQSPEPLDREAAARGLAFVTGNAADRLLRKTEGIETNRMFLSAIRRTRQMRREAVTRRGR